MTAKLRRCGGFTLLEILIAVAISIIAAGLAYGGLSSVIRAQQGQEGVARDLADLQTTYRMLRDDFEQVVPRPGRDDLGDIEQPLTTGSSGLLLSLTRGGEPNPARQPRGEQARVYYRLADGTLHRGRYVYVDRTAGSPVTERVVLEGVESLELRFLDGDRRWQPTWPPLQSPRNVRALPYAVETQLTLESGQSARWLFALPL